jgi:Cysteine protease
MRESNQFFTGDEYQSRLGIYLANKRLVQEHNAANKGFKVAMNKYAAMTPAEYKSLLGFKQIHSERKNVASSVAPSNDSVDWRKKGVVNAIKDQGQCGSCWAFASVMGAEGCYAVKFGKLYSLSEQNCVDCVDTCMGCNGGGLDQTYQYIIDHQNGNLDSEADYPYVAYDQNCKYDAGKAVKIGMKGYTDINEGDEKDLASKCAQYGPVAVAIDASNWSFQLYSSGIYDEPACSSTQLDHGVGVVGYGSEGSKNYWIIRNSWGTSWGEEGYMRMIKDKNNRCGIATNAVFPTF